MTPAKLDKKTRRSRDVINSPPQLSWNRRRLDLHFSNRATNATPQRGGHSSRCQAAQQRAHWRSTALDVEVK
jgi:hypothetical protein